MILIFGGAHQGKLEYARKALGLSSVYDCRTDSGADEDAVHMAEHAFGASSEERPDAVCGLEEFVLRCARQGVEASEWFRDNRELWQDKILIIRDISGGIVPMDPEMRGYREMNGRLMIYLASEADEVHRVFCGIGKRIK